jgi:hypothetical protein
VTTTFLTQALLRIQRDVRAPFMEKTVLYTIQNTFDPTVGLAIPNDYLELIGLYPTSTDDAPQLDRVRSGRAIVLARDTGDPLVFSRQGANWIIGPAPTAGTVLRIQYYATFAPLVNPTDTNILTQVAWDLWVYAALSFAADYYTDKRGAGFEARFNQIKDSLQGMADEDELTANAVVQPAYFWPED